MSFAFFCGPRAGATSFSLCTGVSIACSQALGALLLMPVISALRPRSMLLPRVPFLVRTHVGIWVSIFWTLWGGILSSSRWFNLRLSICDLDWLVDMREWRLNLSKTTQLRSWNCVKHMLAVGVLHFKIHPHFINLFICISPRRAQGIAASRRNTPAPRSRNHGSTTLAGLAQTCPCYPCINSQKDPQGESTAFPTWTVVDPLDIQAGQAPLQTAIQEVDEPNMEPLGKRKQRQGRWKTEQAGWRRQGWKGPIQAPAWLRLFAIVFAAVSAGFQKGRSVESCHARIGPQEQPRGAGGHQGVLRTQVDGHPESGSEIPQRQKEAPTEVGSAEEREGEETPQLGGLQGVNEGTPSQRKNALRNRAAGTGSGHPGDTDCFGQDDFWQGRGNGARSYAGRRYPDYAWRGKCPGYYASYQRGQGEGRLDQGTGRATAEDAGWTSLSCAATGEHAEPAGLFRKHAGAVYRSHTAETEWYYLHSLVTTAGRQAPYPPQRSYGCGSIRQVHGEESNFDPGLSLWQETKDRGRGNCPRRADGSISELHGWPRVDSSTRPTNGMSCCHKGMIENDTGEMHQQDTKLPARHLWYAQVSQELFGHFALASLWLWHGRLLWPVAIFGYYVGGLNVYYGRDGYFRDYRYAICLPMSFLAQGAHGSITDEMEHFLRGSVAPQQLDDDAGDVGDLEWRHWNWVTEYSGLPRPPDGNDQRWQLFRTVEPRPDRMTIWVLGTTDAVGALRRVESYWDDLPAYDGDQLHWRAYPLHPSSEDSRTMEEANWRAIIVSNNEDVHMAQHVPMYYEIRYHIQKQTSIGTVEHGKAIYAPRLITAPNFLDMVNLLSLCIKQFRCVVSLDGVITPQLMHIKAGSFVVITLHMVELQRDSDEEMEEARPLPAADRDASSDTSASYESEHSAPHTPTICGFADMVETYHIYRPDFHRGMPREIMFVDTDQRSALFPEVGLKWPDVANIEWHLLPLPAAYRADHPAAQPCTTLLLHVPQDFVGTPHKRGIVILFVYLHERSTRAYPISTPLRLHDLWRWAGIEVQCIRATSWECYAFLNGDLILHGMDYPLNHGDYVRIQVEQARSRGDRNQLLPLTADEHERKIDAQCAPEHDRWPQSLDIEERRPKPSSSTTTPMQDHAGYWICMAWMMMGAAGALLRLQCRRKAKKRRRPNRDAVRKPIRSIFYAYLLLSAQVGDSLQFALTGSSVKTTVELYDENSEHSAILRLQSHDAFERLPPPGNPCPGLELTETGKDMIGWINRIVSLELSKREIWRKLHYGGDGSIGPPFLPIATSHEDVSGKPFDFVDSGSQASLMTDKPTCERPMQRPTATAVPISLFDELSRTYGLGRNVVSVWGSDVKCHDRENVKCFTHTWPRTNIPTLSHLHDGHPCILPEHLDAVCHGEPPLEIALYTDGSYDSKHTEPNATWAFAIFAVHKTALHLLDWYGDFICLDPLDACWVGAQHDSIRSGEASALQWALLWLCAHGMHNTASLHSDVLSVLQAGTGQWTHHLEDAQMQRLRATFLLTTTIWKDRSLGTPARKGAHRCGRKWSGRPYCAQNSSRRTTPSRTTYTASSMVPRYTTEDIERLDTLGRPVQAHPFSTDDWPKAPSYWAIPAEMPKWIELPHSVEAAGNVHLRCATFNVHTLRQRGAVSFLRQQCEEHMLHLIGLQETRTPDAVTIDTSYMRFVGSAISGNGGVELWVSKTQQLCTDEGPTTLRREDVVVLHAESTLLIAKVRILGTVATCIVAYAPHRGHLRETISNWWTQLIILLKQYRCTPPFILMIDANATVAAQQPRIGEHGARDPDTAGTLFMHFCKTQEVALPCTFQNIHPGSTATMLESNALHQGTRNDYIGISQSLLDLCVASWVEPSMDAGHGKIDHLAVFLDIQWPIRTTTKRPSTVHFDRAKIAMATPETWEAFFQDWPTIPWHMDVTSHVKAGWGVPSGKADGALPQRPLSSTQLMYVWHYQRPLWAKTPSTQTTIEHKIYHRALDAAICIGRMDGKMRKKITCTYIARYRHLSGNLKHGLRQDQAQWLQDRVGLIENHPTKDIAKLLRPLRMGKRVRHLGYRQLPQVRLEDGTLATTHEQTLTRWRSHFSTMEGGRNTSPEDLWETWQTQRNVFVNHDMPENLDDIPTVFELEHFMRQSKCNKAMGHDLLPGELLHYAAPHMATRLWPVMAKMSMWVDEPLQWKSGRLITAYKHKGNVQDPGSYRALLVSSSLGKAMHNVWRRRVYPYVQSGASPLQFSAQHRALVTQASHCARLFAYQAEQNDRSCFLIFLDIQSAYYQLIRQHAVDLSFEDSNILEFLRRMGIDPMHIDDLAAILSQPSALEQQGCPSHLHQMVSEVHRSTWWKLEADPTLTQTSKGTRPGDGFADVLWSMVFSRYINKINECLTSVDICRSLSWNGEVAFLSGRGERSIPGGAIVWADDAVIAADHSDPHRMIPMLQTSMVIIINELIKLGMKPNMAKGKTEAMVILRGRGSKKIKQYLHCHCKGQVTLDIEQPEYQTLRVVSRYVHLGGVLTHDGRLKHEIRRRLAMAHDAIHPYRSKIFSNPKISLDKRVKLLQSTAMAALLYNVGTWPQLTKGEMRLWSGGVLRLYKTVFHRLYDIDTQFHMTMDQVIALTNLPSPELLLSLQRAKQLGHYLQRECDYFWALVGQGQYWMDVVYEDLRMLNAQVKGFTNLPELDDERTCEIWQQQWQARPTKFKSLFRRAQAHHVGQTRLRYEVASFHERLHGILLPAGLSYSGMHEDVEKCNPTTVSFVHPIGQRLERGQRMPSKKHGRLSKYRRLQQGSRCDACGTDYATHSRLCRHLRSSPACAATLAAQQHWVSPGLVTGNREADRIDDENCLIPCIHTGGDVLTSTTWMGNDWNKPLTSWSVSADWTTGPNGATEDSLQHGDSPWRTTRDCGGAGCVLPERYSRKPALEHSTNRSWAMWCRSRGPCAGLSNPATLTG